MAARFSSKKIGGPAEYLVTPRSREEASGGSRQPCARGRIARPSLSIVAGHWQLAICWCVAMAIVYPFCAAVRQVLEHRDEKANPSIDYATQDHGAINRLFKHDLMGYIFGAAGFDRHLLHHWEPTLSYTCLPELEQFLRNTPACKEILEPSQTSSPSIFLRLFFKK